MNKQPVQTGKWTRLLALVSAVVFLTIVGSVSAYAYWVTSSTVTGGVRTADPAVQLGGAEALLTTYTATSTGPVIAPLTLEATGDVPLQLSLASSSTNSGLSGAIRLRTWLSGGSCGSAIPSSGVTTSTLAAPQLPGGAATLTGPASIVVCAATDVVGSYASHSGQATTVTLTLTGRIANTTWQGTASGSFTQTLASSSPKFTCTPALTTLITISWANTPSANTGTIYRSRVNGSLPSGLANRDYYYRTYSSQGWSGTGLPAAAGYYPWVIEETTDGVTSVAFSGQVEVYWDSSWSTWGLRCVN